MSSRRRPGPRPARCAAFGCLILCSSWPAAYGQVIVPQLTGRVVDRAEIVSTSVEKDLTVLLAEQERQTGNQVVVLTISSLGEYTVEEYALSVAREWQLGSRDNDDGVLFLVAVNDREMRIEVGYGLEGVLPDVTASRILRSEVRPHFRNGDFDRGIRAGVVAILSALEGSYPSPEVSSDRPPFWFGLVFMIIPSLFAFLGVLSTGCFRWFLFLFLMPFFFVSGLALAGSWVGGVVCVGIYCAVYIVAQAHPAVRRLRKKMEEEGSVRFGPVVIGGGGSGSSFGGFSGGGGGFSGGGGSFGGGGASGSW